MAHEIHGETVTTRHSGPAPARARGLEVLAIAKGRTRWSVDGRVYDLKQGEAVFVLPGQVFSGIESPESIPVVVDRVRVVLPARGEDGRTAAKLSRALGIRPGDAKREIGAVGLRPMRNGIRVSWLRIDGTDSVLRETI